MTQKIVVNASSGAAAIMSLTADEEAEIAAMQATFAAERAAHVPASVSPYQARVALHRAGLLSNVDALMSREDVSTEARIAWEYATEIHRKSAFVNVLAPALGLTDVQIDDLFRSAVGVE